MGQQMVARLSGPPAQRQGLLNNGSILQLGASHLALGARQQQAQRRDSLMQGQGQGRQQGQQQGQWRDNPQQGPGQGQKQGRGQGQGQGQARGQVQGRGPGAQGARQGLQGALTPAPPPARKGAAQGGAAGKAATAPPLGKQFSRRQQSPVEGEDRVRRGRGGGGRTWGGCGEGGQGGSSWAVKGVGKT